MIYAQPIRTQLILAFGEKELHSQIEVQKQFNWQPVGDVYVLRTVHLHVCAQLLINSMPESQPIERI